MKIMKNWLRELVFTRPSYIWYGDTTLTISSKEFNRFKVAAKLGYITLTHPKKCRFYDISYNDEKIKEFLLNYYSFSKKLG